ncbi:hypothetical protein LSH36_2497g00000 [Paralvinella palmiformis]|uniref:Uncharacterized protein n=1 Tax=Paralvinella palmiformis TaxID=53620 RepID=A0AAD9MP90_9ANNE|nr:hypothetical protein LSH36_2497g00000 [Paralvinella palmiformis]
MSNIDVDDASRYSISLTIRIKTENEFQDSSVTYGERSKFKTLEENCVKDTVICHKANITVPTNQHLRSTQVPDIYDFTVDVPLADTEGTEFIFFHSGLNSCRGDEQNNSSIGRETIPGTATGQSYVSNLEYEHLGISQRLRPRESQNTEYEHLPVKIPQP